MSALTLAGCRALDAALPLPAAWAEGIAPGAPDTVYLDANSIGPMPSAVPARLAALLDDGWRIARRRSWNEADWLDQPRLLGEALSGVLGARPADVWVCDSTSINHAKLLHLALAVRAPRRVVVLQQAVFPSNRHAAQGLQAAGLCEVRSLPEASEIAAHLQAALALGDVAVVSLSHVDYRSGERLDMAALTQLAHAHGALVLWDASHSAGALPLQLEQAGADLAVGCGYKYLCGGPGAPSWLYVSPRWQGQALPLLAGWMGHADTFGFGPEFVPAPGVARLQVGTPPVIANAAMACAAALWRGTSPAVLAQRHHSLTESLVRLVDEQLAPRGLVLSGPRVHAHRGGHVALRFEAPGANVQALGQALVAAGLVVSTRQPDSLRLAPHPLATRHEELFGAVQRICRVLDTAAWRLPQFQGPSI